MHVTLCIACVSVRRFGSGHHSFVGGHLCNTLDNALHVTVVYSMMRYGSRFMRSGSQISKDQVVAGKLTSSRSQQHGWLISISPSTRIGSKAQKLKRLRVLIARVDAASLVAVGQAHIISKAMETLLWDMRSLAARKYSISGARTSTD